MDPTAARAQIRSTNYGTWRRQRGFDPPLIVGADGARFRDDQGHELLDFASQLVATNLGFGNRAVIDAISRQAASVPFAAPGFGTLARGEISAKLSEVLPEGLRSYFFSTSGTEANEAALKIARLVTGRRKVLARTRSYHGSTAASISVTGDPRRTRVEPAGTVPGTVFAPDCFCYRCPLGLTYPSCGVACADEVDVAIRKDPEIGAMIVEPVVGTNGVIPPVPEYLPKVREITRRHGVLLIADEVMTGWGRTGAWFAVDHWKVRPDILTTAKGITSAYVPLGLTATTPELHRAFDDRFFPHGHTYEAHPVALAAGVAAISEYQRLGLPERSRREGEHLLRRLREVAARHRSVGEVRGMGLFCALELVRDRASREPFNGGEDFLEGRPLVVEEVVRALKAEGVYAMGWISHLILAPPLIISREDLDVGVDAVDRALRVADAHSSEPAS